MKSLILGSNSPRRKELLLSLGFDFQIRTNSIDEVVPDHISCDNAALYLAIEKNKVIGRSDSEIVLTADTVVIQDNQLLGKPENEEEAVSILEKLSGKSHKVITGVNISSIDHEDSFSIETEVTFGVLTATDISTYIHSFTPYDKAGAYGIQEWIGMAHIQSIRGSFYNVVGLPTERVYRSLTNNFGLIPLLKHLP